MSPLKYTVALFVSLGCLQEIKKVKIVIKYVVFLNMDLDFLRSAIYEVFFCIT
jgi:hypothetical protein